MRTLCQCPRPETVLGRCVDRLGLALERLQQHEPGELIHEVYRSACTREFEIILRESVRLLRRHLRPYFGSDHRANSLTHKDVFRYAARHGLISIQECERWLGYWDDWNKASCLHDEDFPEAPLSLLPQLIEDARELTRVITEAPADE